VGSWSFIMARPGLPDDVAYRLARALHRGESALGARLPQARETTAANTVAAVARPELLHRGSGGISSRSAARADGGGVRSYIPTFPLSECRNARPDPT
jgi:hypothetical protein